MKDEKQLYLPITPELALVNKLKKDLQRNRRTKKANGGKISRNENTQSFNKEIQELGQRIDKFINNP